MKLLTDQSLAIPPFLQRNDDGSMTYPGLPVAVTAAVTVPPRGEPSWEEQVEIGRERDRIVAAALEQMTTVVDEQRRKEKSATDSARRAHKREEKQERLLRARLNSYKHLPKQPWE